VTLTTAATVAAVPAPLRLTPRNVVCVTKITDALDLPALAAAIPGADYNPRTFPGMIVRMSAPKAAALVFNSGKLVLTGLPHPDAIPAAFAAALEDLRTAGAELDPAPRQPKIVNLVTSGKYPAAVNLHHLAISRNLENLEYEPESFPGLVYRCETVRAVCLVFGSGAIVVTGTTGIPDAETAAAEVERAITAADAWRPAA
jgi:transcription initiation factor TFIID TATA-box-binding protein